MNDKQFNTRFFGALALCFIIMFLLCAPAEAWQLTPNPNYGTITIDTHTDTTEDFNNLGDVIIEDSYILTNYHVITNSSSPPTYRGCFSILGTLLNENRIDNYGDVNNWAGGTIDNYGNINNLSGGRIDNHGDINNLYGGTIDNSGSIYNRVGGTINIWGVIDNEGVVVNRDEGYIYNYDSGTINNFSEIFNYGSFVNSGIIDNPGEIYNLFLCSTIENSGTIYNSGKIHNIYGDTIANSGDIYNSGVISIECGTIENSGTIKNESGSRLWTMAGSTILNDGTINNSGEIRGWQTDIYNSGIINNGFDGIIINERANDNSGTINNYGTIGGYTPITNSGIINNYGSFDNVININNTGTIENMINSKITSRSMIAIIDYENGKYIATPNTISNENIIKNAGLIDNWSSIIDNLGTIQNTVDGIIRNQQHIHIEQGYEGYIYYYGDPSIINNLGTINNSGTIDNSFGTFINQGIFNNYYIIDNYYDVNNLSGGTINNDSTIKNRSGGTVGNDGNIHNKLGGTIDNEGNIHNRLGGTINNEGTIDNKFGGYIKNDGTINNESFINNGYEGRIDNSGIINNSGTIDNSSGTFNNYGIYQGTGTFVGTLDTGSGTVAPGSSVGTMYVEGDYILNSGTLEIEIGGSPSSCDLLDITGTATLTGGTINFLFIDGYDNDIASEILPGKSMTLQFLHAVGGIVGFGPSLANYSFLGGPSGFEYNVYQDSNGLYFHAANTNVIPAPGAVLLCSIGAGLVGWLRRRRTI